MADKAVFLERDHVLIEEPALGGAGYAPRLLPGVELALKGLVQAGYRLVVVVNQPGVARGLVGLERVREMHDRLREMLRDRSVPLEAVYCCPFHPEGTVEEFARQSDCRMPRPGMLLQAARDLHLDLPASWMVGPGTIHVEAGQRAGCRTIRVRTGHDSVHGEEPACDEDTQADFTVRNLVDAARIILRERPTAGTTATGAKPVVETAAGSDGEAQATAAWSAAHPPVSEGPSVQTDGEQLGDAVPGESATPPAEHGGPPVFEATGLLAATRRGIDPSDSQVLREVLQHVRHLDRSRQHREFIYTRLFGAVAQLLAIATLVYALVRLVGVASPTTPGELERLWLTMGWLGVAGLFQLLALTMFILSRRA